MSKAYSSNLTQWQWELIEPLIPLAKPGGRDREVEIWSVLNAIFYVLTQGCTWRNLPGDFPAWQTVYTYFRNWRLDGTWVTIHERLRDWVRSEQERKPEMSEAIIDSQSVKTAAMVNQSVGYDAGKQIKGRKRAARFGCWAGNPPSWEASPQKLPFCDRRYLGISAVGICDRS